MIERDRETNVLIRELQLHLPTLPQTGRRGEEARSMPHTNIPEEEAADGGG